MTRRLSLRRRRGADAPDAEPPAPSTDAAAPPPADDTTAWTQGTPPTAVHDPAGSVRVDEPATAVHEPGVAAPVVVPAPDPSAPAGLDVQPTAAPPTPSFKDRGRLRRRLRYLRRVRELGFRDLGGLVFDLHRFGRDGQPLVAGKLDALTAVDRELRALEHALAEREDFVVLREPGIGACTRCAALHGSDANFCPNCGLPFSGPQAIAEVGDAPPQAPVPAPPADATWNWPAPAAPAYGSGPVTAAGVPAARGAAGAPAPAAAPGVAGSAAAAPAPGPPASAPAGAPATPAPELRKDPEPETVSASEAGDRPVSSGLGPLVPEEEQPTTVQPAVDAEPPRDDDARPS